MYDNTAPFQFSQKLPLNESSLDDLTKKLISIEGFSDTEYNQLIEVKYLASEKDYAVFRVKCEFKMKTYLVSAPETIKNVTGSFTFNVRTTKK